MNFIFRDELVLVPDLRHRLRQLRWFRMAFRNNAALVTRYYGYHFSIDDTRLTRAFLNWIETIELQKSYASVDRRDFIVFAAGMALKELIVEAPVKALNRPVSDARSPQEMREIIAFWPEGFLYTNYCVGAIAAICQQEFGSVPEISKCAEDLRTWWSYRENVAEVPAYAIAFLDKFVGVEPNWIAPDLASARNAIRRAALGKKPASPILPSG